MFYRNIISPLLNSINNFSERNAFCINDNFYTYDQFGKTISKIRKAITTTDFKNTNVGLVINDDIESYASIFALWLEGYSYVPLHPQWPIERCEEIINQVDIDLILDSSTESRYSNREVSILNTCTLEYKNDFLTIKEGISNESIAYILFTSGSTGKPKGVQIMRKNVAAFINAFFETYQITERDHCIQCFDLTFDLSIISYLVPLLKGACLYIVPSDGVKYVQIGSIIEDEQITFALMAPSTIKYLKPYFNEIDCSSLRYSLFCGEALHLDITKSWAQCASNAEIYNVYGPTEDTIWCSSYKFDRDKKNKTYNGVLSIGRPISGCKMEIFKENLQICNINELGELCLTGEQLTPGYFNNPLKNNECFFIKDGIRWYRSGDLCYKDEDGDIMYSGRLDHQAKIQGFRVEMGEIEFHAREFLAGPNVVCLAYDNAKGLTEIAMFIESATQSTDKLIEYMRTKMPAYMIPSQIIFQEIFELNSNGKIDKNKLKQLIKK